MPEVSIPSRMVTPISFVAASRSLRYKARGGGCVRYVSKQTLFTPEERTDLIRAAVDNDSRVTVQHFQGLTVDFAKQSGVLMIIRGLRAASDFEYEYQMALMNRHLAPQMETVFMVPSLDTTYISSSLVREVARFPRRCLEGLVHPAVEKALIDKFPKK